MVCMLLWRYENNAIHPAQSHFSYHLLNLPHVDSRQHPSYSSIAVDISPDPSQNVQSSRVALLGRPSRLSSVTAFSGKHRSTVTRLDTAVAEKTPLVTESMLSPEAACCRDRGCCCCCAGPVGTERGLCNSGRRMRGRRNQPHGRQRPH